MRTRGYVSAVLVLLAAVGAARSAQAQLNRTAVSVTGNDLNDCSVANPCRNFSRAISQTNAGGEVVALDSGGYGPFTVDRSVTVQAAPGVYAGVTATSGSGIIVGIGPGGKVVLRGLTIEGLGLGSVGIDFRFPTGSGGDLHVERCVIDGFTLSGILMAFRAQISDTVVRRSNWGILIANAGTVLTAERLQLKENSSAGLFVQDGAKGTVRHCLATGNGMGLAAVFTNSELNIEDCEATLNTTGFLVDSGAKVRVSNSTSTHNSSCGFRKDGTGVMETWSNNRSAGNFQESCGTLTPVSAQ